MAVDVMRECRRGVPKSLLRDLRVDALLEEQRGVTMPQIVEPDAGNFSTLHDALEIAPDDVVGMQRFTQGLAEYEAQVLISVASLLLLPVPYLRLVDQAQLLCAGAPHRVFPSSCGALDFLSRVPEKYETHREDVTMVKPVDLAALDPEARPMKLVN